jgi:hypothetical protein
MPAGLPADAYPSHPYFDTVCDKGPSTSTGHGRGWAMRTSSVPSRRTTSGIGSKSPPQTRSWTASRI